MTLNHHEQIFTGYSTRYGSFEMRAKGSNAGGGGHTAWWMVGTQEDQDASGDGAHQSAEIDVTENLMSDPRQWLPKLHPWTDTSIRDSAKNVTLTGDPADEYHLYAMDWTPDGLSNHMVTSIDQAPNYPMGMLLGIYTDASTGPANNVWRARSSGPHSLERQPISR